MKQRETRGKIEQMKGRAKEAVGIITGDTELEQEGSRERTEGAVQESLGKARRKVGAVVDGIRKAIRN